MIGWQTAPSISIRQLIHAWLLDSSPNYVETFLLTTQTEAIHCCKFTSRPLAYSFCVNPSTFLFNLPFPLSSFTTMFRQILVHFAGEYLASPCLRPTEKLWPTATTFWYSMLLERRLGWDARCCTIRSAPIWVCWNCFICVSSIPVWLITLWPISVLDANGLYSITRFPAAAGLPQDIELANWAVSISLLLCPCLRPFFLLPVDTSTIYSHGYNE